MAEIIFANVSEQGITTTVLTGASGSLGNLYIKGTQGNSTTTGDARVVNYNFESQLETSTSHGKLRGLNFIVFNQDMSREYIATFDVYGQDSACTALATRIESLTDTQIAVISSYDAIKSNQSLDDAMTSVRSVSWPGRTFFVENVNHARSSYSAIICGKKKAIVAEKFVGNGVPKPDAVIELPISNPLNIGYSGFGHLLISDDTIIQNQSHNKSIHYWINNETLDSLNIKVGDSFYFKSLGEIDEIAASGGLFLRYNIGYYNSDGDLIDTEIRDVRSVEGWEEVEIRGTIPTGTHSISVWISQETTKKLGFTLGICYAKMTTMQLCDNSEVTHDGVSFGVYASKASSIEDSLGNFGQYDPKGYYQAHCSTSNLLWKKSITGDANEPARWFDRILESPTERSVLKPTAAKPNSVAQTEAVTIDPTKFYYACGWVNKQHKESGSYRFGFVGLDGSSSKVVMRKTNDYSVTGTDLYAQMPPYDTLEQRQWYLIQGFIIPHTWDVERSIEFIDENKEFYGWDDLYGSGIGLSDEGNSEYGWVNNANTKTGYLTLVDSDNSSDSKSFFALPILRELRSSTVDMDDGRLTSINLSG